MAAIPVRTSAVLAPNYPQAVVRPRTRVRVNWFAAFVTFVFVAYAAFSAASLAGSVLTEKARRDGLNAVARSRAAKAEVEVLSAQVDGLKSMDSIARWAAQNGFVAPDRLAASSLDTTPSKPRAPRT